MVEHAPGKNLHTPDALPRAPAAASEGSDLAFQETFVSSIVEYSLPATKQRLNTYREAQGNDPVCKELKEYCHQGWPE